MQNHIQSPMKNFRESNNLQLHMPQNNALDKGNSISQSSLDLSMSPLPKGIYTPNTKSRLHSQKKSQENWNKKKIRQEREYQNDLINDLHSTFSKV